MHNLLGQLRKPRADQTGRAQEVTMRKLVLGAFGSALLLSTSAYALDGWHIDRTTTLAANSPGYDYISYDAGTNKVFLGHRKEGLQVFDPVEKKVVKIIDGTQQHLGNSALLIPEFDLG